jgi:hypothetical protein
MGAALELVRGQEGLCFCFGTCVFPVLCQRWSGMSRQLSD